MYDGGIRDYERDVALAGVEEGRDTPALLHKVKVPLFSCEN
jgi:hypothetical protein